MLFNLDFTLFEYFIVGVIFVTIKNSCFNKCCFNLCSYFFRYFIAVSQSLIRLDFGLFKKIELDR